MGELSTLAAAALKEKIVDFFVCLHGAGPVCK